MSRKTETLKLSLQTSISEGFSILVLLLDKSVLEIDIDLFTVFSVSIIWVDLDLYIDLFLSVLLILGAYTVLLDACYFSVFFTVSILFFSEIGGVMDSLTTLGFVPFFYYHFSIPFFDSCVSTIDQCLFGFIQIPTCFSNLFTWCIRFLWKWVTGIGRHDFSAWSSPPC